MARYILTTDQSDAGRAGIFSRRTNGDPCYMSLLYAGFARCSSEECAVWVTCEMPCNASAKPTTELEPLPSKYSSSSDGQEVLMGLWLTLGA
eukprot:1180435-Prorocentrum_minimum.AAC.5